MPDSSPDEKTDATDTTRVERGLPPTTHGGVSPDKIGLPSIPNYQLLRCIGRGAYGEVWLGRSVVGALHAIKVVHRQNFETDRPYDREFAGIQKFEPVSRSHPGLVHVLYVGRNDQAGYFYYVMELADDVAGGAQVDPGHYEPKTLRSEIQQRGRLPVEECLGIGLALANGLAHLHEQGLVHRDIKPSNIVFVKGAPKLADIGLVCGTEGTVSYAGTEWYIPPDGPGSPQHDLYSLGKVFYEMSTGKEVQAFPDLPTELRGDGERMALLEFNEVLVKACANEVRQRYQSARELGSDLALLQLGKSVKRQRRARKRWAVAKVVGAAAALALLAVALLPLVKLKFAGKNSAVAESPSIAVLPFENRNPGPADESLTEGIPDSILSELTKIPGLKVAGRQSSFAFGGTNQNRRQIGETLNVRTVLEGSVRKSGDKLHITAELIKTADGYQLMFDNYNREMKDVLTIPG